MDREPTPHEAPGAAPDDAQLGALVRAVADDWRQPPQRLGQPTWRDRVDADRRGSGGGGRRWFGRLAGAGALALVATVVLAVTAVYLTGPRTDRGTIGASQSPSTGPTPTSGSSAAPSSSAGPVAPTPLPALLVNGDLPSVTSVLLQGSGGYRVADLTTGTLGKDLPFPGGESGTVLPRPDGGWDCICVTYDESGGGAPTSLHITVRAATASGEAEGTLDLGAVTSEATTTSPDFTQVDVHVDASPDGRFAYVSSSHRTEKGWRAHIDVVDLKALDLVDTIAIPDVDHAPDANGKSWVGLAPIVSMRLDGDIFLISRAWYVDDSTTSTPAYGTDRWIASPFGDPPQPVPAIPSSASCGDLDQGLIDDASFYVACVNQTGEVHVARYRVDGTQIDDTDVGPSTGFGVMQARGGSALFLWDPQARRLSRYDLATGRSDTLKAPSIGATDGPLDALGDFGRSIGQWLAPTATAKIFLQPAMAISDDGKTLYALGIDSSGGSLGSSGIDAFDVGGDTLTFKSHWESTADFISIAISEDGGFVYAAGMGGVSPSGIADDRYKPSVTVFDTADGSVRLVAGQLTGNELYFLEPVVR